MGASTNTYLEQVVAQKAAVDVELRQRKTRAAPAGLVLAPSGGGGGGEARAVDYRITGLWRFQTVVVPPNVHVVHTRRGKDKPVTMGLGTSFRFDPYTDSFLLIPAAVQTIVINANCICSELQGVLVQAYVQWVVDEVGTAYKRLDFSDTDDPMRLVNVQLREQAEAALKDKVSTMAIGEVLSDKKPLIQELTLRLRDVAEGLGLSIVTVQIKEAVVSSTTLWDNLQKPFRSERRRLARLAELEADERIAAQELSDHEQRQLAQLQVEAKVAAERAETEKADNAAKALLEKQLAALERERSAREFELIAVRAELDAARAKVRHAQVEAELTIARLQAEAAHAATQRELELERTRRELENLVNEPALRGRLIERLPEIAESVGAPEEYRVLDVRGAEGAPGALLGFVDSAMAALKPAAV